MTLESELAADVAAEDWFRRHGFIHHNYTDAQIHPFASEQYAGWVRGVSGTDADFPGDEKMWFESLFEMKRQGIVGEGPEV